MKKFFWKLYKKYCRWRIRKEIGEEPKGTGKPVEWVRWKSLDEMYGESAMCQKEEKTMNDTTKMFFNSLEKGVVKGHNELELTLDRRGMVEMYEDMERMMKAPETEIAQDNMEPTTAKVSCLYDTVDHMVSKDYKERFYAEYWQLKIRYEKLKKLNTRNEAYRRVSDAANYENMKPTVKELPHDCPNEMLRAQQHIMGEYLHILEVRAVIEGIDLNAEI